MGVEAPGLPRGTRFDTHRASQRPRLAVAFAVGAITVAVACTTDAPVATHIAFVTPVPLGVTSEATFGPVIIAFLNNSNVVDESVTAPVTISLQSAFSGASAPIAGVLTTTPSAGHATFDGLSIVLAGGYNLVAKAAGFDSIVSAFFVVGAGTESQLMFKVQPTNGVAGSALPSFTVAITDAAGNTTSASRSVNITLGANPTGATLSGTTTATINGSMAFTNVSVDKPGTYTLVASTGDLTSATSVSFTVAP